MGSLKGQIKQGMKTILDGGIPRKIGFKKFKNQINRRSNIKGCSRNNSNQLLSASMSPRTKSAAKEKRADADSPNVGTQTIEESAKVTEQSPDTQRRM